MKTSVNAIRNWFGLLAVCALVVFGFLLFRTLSPGNPFAAYPLPVMPTPLRAPLTVTPTVSALLPSTAIPTQPPYPPPATPTQTTVGTPTPTATRRVGPPPPPPGYPTNLPWPPPTTTPGPTATPRVFPTPLFPPTPAGQRPPQLQNVWFPYYLYAGSMLQLRAVQMDQAGQRWGQDDSGIDLGIDEGRIPYASGGPQLNNLHLSPDQRWVAVDIAFRPSSLIDLSSRTHRPIMADPKKEVEFITWAPDSRRIIAASRSSTEIWLVDVLSQSYERGNFPSLNSGDSLLQAVAYSPNNRQLADAVVYPRSYAVRDIEMAEIGLRDGERGERKIVAQIPAGFNVVAHSLQWSSNDRKLIWVANVESPANPTPPWPSNLQAQLWIFDLANNNAKKLAVLGKDIQYEHPAVWAPDMRYIATIKEETPQGNNIYLIDPDTGTERQLTRFNNRRLSHPAWSPNSQWVAFAISMGEYAEIWVTNLSGTQQYPLAGPVAPRAPFVWTR